VRGGKEGRGSAEVAMSYPAMGKKKNKIRKWNTVRKRKIIRRPGGSEERRGLTYCGRRANSRQGAPEFGNGPEKKSHPPLVIATAFKGYDEGAAEAQFLRREKSCQKD